MKWIFVASLVLMAVLTGCASEKTDASKANAAVAADATSLPAGPDLDGSWRIALPSHRTQDVTIIGVRGNLYQMHGRNGLTFNGLYAFRDGHLVVIKPDDKRLTEYDWRMTKPDSFILVAVPPVAKTGSNPLGATMTRLAEPAPQ